MILKYMNTSFTQVKDIEPMSFILQHVARKGGAGTDDSRWGV